MKEIYIITGPSGVGKSTISRIVANGLKKSVLIEGDKIYNMVVGGGVRPFEKGNHLPFFWKNVFMLIQNSIDEGYDVILDYIIHHKSLDEIKRRFADCKIKFTVLTAKTKDIVARDKMRAFDCQMGAGRIQEQLNEFEQQKFDFKFSLDTTSLTANESAQIILKEDNFYI